MTFGDPPVQTPFGPARVFPHPVIVQDWQAEPLAPVIDIKSRQPVENPSVMEDLSAANDLMRRALTWIADVGNPEASRIAKVTLGLV